MAVMGTMPNTLFAVNIKYPVCAVALSMVVYAVLIGLDLDLSLLAVAGDLDDL